MFEVIKDGKILTCVDTPTYIYKHKYGFYALCDKRKAQGVAINGVLYNLQGKKPMDELETVTLVEKETGNEILNINEILAAMLVGNTMTHAELLKASEQFRRAVQMFSVSLTDEQAMEVVTIYDPWRENKFYAVGDFVTYGISSVGDPQLYRVVQAHTSQADWTPDMNASLFTAIGLDEEGYPVWSQPTGAHDAYNTGDIVDYNGTLYRCLIDGNVYSPEVYPAGWEVVGG